MYLSQGCSAVVTCFCECVAKLTKVVRLCPGLMKEEAVVMGEGQTQSLRHIFSHSLILALLLLFSIIHPFKTSTYEVAKCIRRDGCSNSCLQSKLQYKNGLKLVLKSHFAVKKVCHF